MFPLQKSLSYYFQFGSFECSICSLFYVLDIYIDVFDGRHDCQGNVLDWGKKWRKSIEVNFINSIIRKQPPKCVFIEAIWKSWHRHLSISIVIGISIGIGIAKTVIFAFLFFLDRTFMSYPYLSYGISTTSLHFATYSSTIFY